MGRTIQLPAPPYLRQDWKGAGACQRVDNPDVFYPGRGAPSQAAKRLCADCPVLQECLQAALETHPQDDWGIWGGTTKDERARLRKERGIAHPNRAFKSNPEIRPVSV